MLRNASQLRPYMLLNASQLRPYMLRNASQLRPYMLRSLIFLPHRWGPYADFAQLGFLTRWAPCAELIRFDP